MHYLRPSVSKINLLLSITGKLPNGYHEIDTVFLPLSCPEDMIGLRFTDDCDISISSNSSIVPCDCRNLCWKAVELYEEATGEAVSCTIHIEKRIPIAAGMGGGSSNAATVLAILNEHYGILSDNELAEIALSIGADVPFFLEPQLSSATGVGEKLVPVTFEYQAPPIVVVAPHFPVSAAWAYRHCSVSANPVSADSVLDSVKTADVSRLAGLIRNDLALPLYEKFPVLSILKQQILAAGALCAEVSGSGPTMFGLCESSEDAQHVANALRLQLPKSYSVWSS